MIIIDVFDCVLRIPPLLVADFILSRNLLNRFCFSFHDEVVWSDYSDMDIQQHSALSRTLSCSLVFIIFISLIRVSLATREVLAAFYRSLMMLLCMVVSTYVGWTLLDSVTQDVMDQRRSAWYTIAIQLVCTTIVDVVAHMGSSHMYGSGNALIRMVTVMCTFAAPVWIALCDVGEPAHFGSPTTLSLLGAMQLFSGALQTIWTVRNEWFRVAAKLKQGNGPEAAGQAGHAPDRIAAAIEQITSIWNRVHMPRVLVTLALTRMALDCVSVPLAACSTVGAVRDAFSLDEAVHSRIVERLQANANASYCDELRKAGVREEEVVPFEECGPDPFRDTDFNEWKGGVVVTTRCAVAFVRQLGFSLFIDVATMRLCDNLLAVLALAACVSYVSRACCAVFTAFIFGRAGAEVRVEGAGADEVQGDVEEGEPERQSVGSVAAVLFVVLALQSGLTSSPADSRRLRLARHALLIAVANMHVVERLCETRLTQLASRSDKRTACHVRVLLVSCFLLLAAPCCIAVLYAASPSGTFLLAVVVFNAELFVKTACALLVYAVFSISSRRAANAPPVAVQEDQSSDSDSESEQESERSAPPPHGDEDTAGRMDELVFSIKAFASVFEFTCGCILLLNGVYIILFESASAIRAAMMALHAYANIWTQARRGWLAYRTRRLAFNQLARLRTCSPSDVRQYKDVCAICYRHMHAHTQTVLRTHCDHMFHLVCLKKWLFARDSCPLCQQNAYGLSSGPASAS